MLLGGIERLIATHHAQRHTAVSPSLVKSAVLCLRSGEYTVSFDDQVVVPFVSDWQTDSEAISRKIAYGSAEGDVTFFL